MTDKDILISDLNDISEILNNNGYGGWCVEIRKAVKMLKEQEKPNGKCVNECECWDSAYERGKQDALNEQEAKTGHWIQSNPKFVSAKATGGSRMSTCSNCGKWGRKSFSFCPHCGAKMDFEGR